MKKGKDTIVATLKNDVEKAINHIEELTGNKFNDAENPLLVSVRSGARVSMPGMMDTVLNLGMNDHVVEALQRNQEIHASLGIAIAVLFKCTVMSYWG